MVTVDARGLSCPEPVLRARRAMEKLQPGELLEVLVETETARENVSRAAGSMGCEVMVTESEQGYVLSIRRP